MSDVKTSTISCSSPARCGVAPADERLARRDRAGNRFVGNLGLTAGQLFGAAARNNCAEWFAGTTVHYTHTARTAIWKAIVLLKLQPGDEILVPAYHCGSELDVLLSAGLKVRLYRISAAAEIDPEDLQKRITSATKAIYVVHYFGFPQSTARIAELCRSKGIHLIEDCALSPFTESDGRRLGSAGDVAVYNFPKVLPVPDGGALVINNSTLRRDTWSVEPPPAHAVREGVIRLLKQSFLRVQPNISARALFALLSRKENEPAIAAARIAIPESYYFDPAMTDRSISSVSARVLARTDVAELRSRRRENYSRLSQHLSQLPGCKPLFAQLPSGVCPLSLPVVVRDARQAARRLRSRSVPAIAWWAGYHRAALNWNDFPEACSLKDHVLALPIHQQLNDRDVDFIGRQLSGCLDAA
jgi:dTDP-4-amino-4,6-dideoxygalactose transaminase